MSGRTPGPWFRLEIYSPLVNGWRGLQTFKTKRAAYASCLRLTKEPLMASRIASEGWAVDVFCVPPKVMS